MNELKQGDRVTVEDEGLAMLRSICPDMPPNNTGTIERIDSECVYVCFDDGQLAPYPREQVVKT